MGLGTGKNGIRGRGRMGLGTGKNGIRDSGGRPGPPPCSHSS